MKDLSDSFHAKFLELACDLAPENIWRDGEATTRERETYLQKQWNNLEDLVGRKVSADEIWNKQYSKYRKV